MKLGLIHSVAVLMMAVSLLGCGKKTCAVPNINLTTLNSLRSSVLPSATARGYVITPNPIDASGNPGITVDDSSIQSLYRSFNLAGLLDPTKLESDFLKIRVNTITDDLSLLARPNSQGIFAFGITDPHYSETLSYLAVSTELAYLGALGFPLVKSRPLYVMVRALTSTGAQPSEVNAYYDHNYLNPTSPRTIKLFGDTKYAPAVDEDVVMHEFGHYFNESASREVGIDFAGDNLAIYTEASGLHECMADYLSETIRNRAYIGRWIQRNFAADDATKAAGDPLRAAFDIHGKSIMYKDVQTADGTGNLPERYHTAEWCERILWNIRQKFVAEDATGGAVYADRLMFTALGMLKRDTSLIQFHNALVQADEQLYCGNHEDTIKSAFKDKGFEAEPDRLDTPMTLQMQSVGLTLNAQAGLSPTTLAAGGTVGFALALRNNAGQVARNVRVKLESSDPRFHATTYMQAFGDVPAGKSITVGAQGLTYDFTVQGELDKSATGSIPYTLRLMTDNADDVVMQGALKL